MSLVAVTLVASLVLAQRILWTREEARALAEAKYGDTDHGLLGLLNASSGWPGRMTDQPPDTATPSLLLVVAAGNCAPCGVAVRRWKEILQRLPQALRPTVTLISVTCSGDCGDSVDVRPLLEAAELPVSILHVNDAEKFEMESGIVLVPLGVLLLNQGRAAVLGGVPDPRTEELLSALLASNVAEAAERPVTSLMNPGTQLLGASVAAR
jgi:hypothetical protein